jgi:hypothetical protein
MKQLVVLSFLLSGFLSASVLGEEKIDFARQIHPILTQTCVECHGPERARGKLRLDAAEFALGKVIVPGKPEESDLFLRVTLPPDDEDIMPPEGDPLTQEQTELLRLWILQGAEWPELMAEAPQDVDFTRDIQPILSQLEPGQVELLRQWVLQGAPWPDDPGAGPQPSWTEFPVSQEETEAIAELQKAGVLVMRLAQNVNLLTANFKLAGNGITDQNLPPVARMPNLVEIDLGNTGITDGGLIHLAQLPNLTRLKLDNTGITDEGMVHLAGLNNLANLNIYGTKVTDAGLDHLKGIATLQKLYIWQTGVTDSGASALKQAIPHLEVIGGWVAPEIPESNGEAGGTEAAQDQPAQPTIATLLLQLPAPKEN